MTTEPPYRLGDLMPAQSPKRRVPVALLVALVAVLAAGAGGGGVLLLGGGESGSAAEPTTGAAPTSSPPGPTATPTAPTPSPSPTAHRFGQKVVNQDGTAQAVVLAYKQPVARDVPKPDEPGMVWGAAQIQVCARDQPIAVSRWRWKLAYADGALVEPSDTGYEGFPAPEYPWDEHPLAAGRCAKGWIVFPVPPKQRPEFVQYHPQNNTLPLEWRVA